MKISSVSLVNYRIYQDFTCNFNDGVNVIYGNNGCGKTNLVESIYFSSYLTSYRSSNDREIIRFGEDFAKVSISSSDQFEIVISKNSKVCKKNNVLISKQSEFVGMLKVVIFSPETMELILKSPSERRKYLDLLLCLCDYTYINVLKEFNHLLKQRNDYLKQLLINNLADPTYLEVLNERYIDVSCKIYKKRSEIVKSLNLYAKDIFKNFFDLELDIVYEVQSGIDFNNLKESFKKKLDSRYERELFLGTTVTGPTRDDLVFNIDGHNAKYFSSKGQQRISLISLKLAEAEIINSIFNEYPVLILDDVLSELDEKRQNILFSVLETKQIQSLITTTDINDIKIEHNFNKINL